MINVCAITTKVLVRTAIFTLIGICLCSCKTMLGGGSGFNLFPTESIAEQSEPLPRGLMMDVGIVEFDPNYTIEQAKKYEVFAEVRKAEAKYFPIRVKDAIEKTNYWNNVWIVPKSAIADVKVSGKIVESTGKKLKLHIQVQDATGKKVLDKVYSEEATEYDYTGGRKPFEVLFTQIAQDLHQKYQGKSHTYIDTVKSDSDVRFASWIAPGAFSHHIDQKSKVTSTPAMNDPIYQQAIRLRGYDELFFDKLQDYYYAFYQNVEEQHTKWLHESYIELEARSQERKDAVVTGILSGLATAIGVAVAASGSRSGNSYTTGAGVAVAGAGAYGLTKAVKKYQRSKVHDEALKELGATSERALQPHVLEVQGKTVQLEGSIEEQYLQWHTVLQQQYNASQ